nr:PREDICTED: LOW QUALITY PROTEIN: VPS10 domain-containing receptor SorCS2-like [Bos mutus]
MWIRLLRLRGQGPLGLQEESGRAAVSSKQVPSSWKEAQVPGSPTITTWRLTGVTQPSSKAAVTVLEQCPPGPAVVTAGLSAPRRAEGASAGGFGGVDPGPIHHQPWFGAPAVLRPWSVGEWPVLRAAPSLLFGPGNLGSQLVEYKEEMYITSDCGHTWRQVFEEEHHILYLDHGGVIVAIKDTSIPLKILKFSVDEGLTWSTHNFTSTSVFVDGLLSEPGDETLVMTVFGHISFRSDWELVKVDFRPWFSRRCSEDDYSSWDLTNLQGDRCVMGQQRSFRRRKPASWCVTGRSFTAALTARVCPCRASDFLCDYGFERAPSSESDANKCFANFWFNPLSPPDDCVLGQTYTSSLGYRKLVSNVCEGGVDPARNPSSWSLLGRSTRTQDRTRVVAHCPSRLGPSPAGAEVREQQKDALGRESFALHCLEQATGSQVEALGRSGRKVGVGMSNMKDGGPTNTGEDAETLGPSCMADADVKWKLHADPSLPEQVDLETTPSGDVLTTKYQVDLGDGFKAMYVNLTLTGEPIRHRYESPGVYRVSVRAENVAGHDEAVLFVQVTAPLQALYLEVVPVIGVNQEVNLTAVLLPLNPNLTVFYWWIGHSLQPRLSLENSVTTRFGDPGDVRVTVQAACGTSVLQDSKVVRVLDQFQVVPLQFSKDLDAHNPNTPEWREDVGLVVSRLLSKETSIPEELMVTVVKPGLPTLADLHVLLPPPRPTRKRSLTSDKRLTAIQQVLKAQKISFLLRGGVRVVVAVRDVDTGPPSLGGGGGYWAVVILFVSGLFAVGAFILYKFKRKRPGRTVYAQMHNEKEQEMTSPVSHSQGVQSAIQGEEFIEDELHPQTLAQQGRSFSELRPGLARGQGHTAEVQNPHPPLSTSITRTVGSCSPEERRVTTFFLGTPRRAAPTAPTPVPLRGVVHTPSRIRKACCGGQTPSAPARSQVKVSREPLDAAQQCLRYMEFSVVSILKAFWPDLVPPGTGAGPWLEP